ncbi:DUF2306 domain-containing protein [Kocuria turfanensis]|uniref:hypothetical protein n=1 Tax=Kocuria turfanensis TaxID=388357 RepID=UPI000787CF7F|nr:hypothetical protein [Kocuria turfanensis]
MTTFGTVTVGLWAARTGRIGAHRAFMRGPYFGVLGVFLRVAAVPDLRIPQLAVHDLPALTLWVVAVLASAALAVYGASLLRGPGTAHRPAAEPPA